MQPERFVTCGLVLRETVTRDADKILTVLTPDRGRLSVIARGARRKGSRVAAACQLLAYSEMTLYEKGRWTMPAPPERCRRRRCWTRRTPSSCSTACGRT